MDLSNTSLLDEMLHCSQPLVNVQWDIFSSVGRWLLCCWTYDSLLLGFMNGLQHPLVRLKVTSRQLTIFLLVSIVILRPFDLNMWQTSCLVFSISFGVALEIARPMSR